MSATAGLQMYTGVQLRVFCHVNASARKTVQGHLKVIRVTRLADLLFLHHIPGDQT